MQKYFNLASLSLAVACCLPTYAVDASQQDDLFDSMSLAGLLNLTVSSASGIEESMRQAPAAMIVITQDDITKRGYTDLSEIFADLPGFDTMVTQGTQQITSYQRGYRTPFMQRTLLLLNGKVDNNLWSHTAFFSRQYPLANIDRIEILYGPAGAVYGPNAFLGVVNVITQTPEQKETSFKLNLSAGSFKTKALDMALSGNISELSYQLGYKFYNSDEAGLDDMSAWGFVDEAHLASRTLYGPVLDHQFNGIDYGIYANRSKESGLTAELAFNDFTLGFIDWKTDNGYGPYYSSDRTQPNQTWNNLSQQLYLEHQTDLTEKLNIKTLLLARKNRVWGGWVEAEPDWNTDMAIESPSYLSISDWNSASDSQLFKQEYNYGLSDTLRLSGGIKYERKALNKAYEVCYYWSGSLCSVADPDDQGPTGNGPGIFHSSADTVLIGPPAQTERLSYNTADTTDEGIFIQGIWDREDWRFNIGLRYDNNSIYGSTVNPRASAVWLYSDNLTFKFLYGTAFQEPAPTQLFGGWSGRKANPDLSPETMSNLEFIMMYQGENVLHDVSIFSGAYEDVIKEDAQNAGTRDTRGLEYRGNYSFANWIEGADDISGYLYYTYTKTDSSIYYDFDAGQWLDGTRNLGDIAPHKFNLGVNIPLSESLNLNVRVNHVTERELYLRNPLRDSSRADGGRKVDAYTTVDLNLNYQMGAVELALKVKNLTDADYHHPGVESANTGDDFTRRSLGYQNSLLPQVGRSYLLSLKWKF